MRIKYFNKAWAISKIEQPKNKTKWNELRKQKKKPPPHKPQKKHERRWNCCERKKWDRNNNFMHLQRWNWAGLVQLTIKINEQIEGKKKVYSIELKALVLNSFAFAFRLEVATSTQAHTCSHTHTHVLVNQFKSVNRLA